MQNNTPAETTPKLIPGAGPTVRNGPPPTPAAPVVPLSTTPPTPPPASVVTPPKRALLPAIEVGKTNTIAPDNRFLVNVEAKQVRIRGLPIGKLSAAEVRGFAAHLLHCADQVATAEDPEFADLFSALIKSQEPAK